jgi:hypothetical protein
VTLGFGTKALSLHGSRIIGDVGEAPPAGQSWYYDTLVPGSAMTGLGAAAILGGVILSTVPARKRAVEVPAAN